MKSLIKFSFSRFSEIYDREAVLQKEAAKILIDFAQIEDGKGLDLGCGTGFLYRFSDWQDLIGIDIALDMLKFYKKFNNHCLQADMEYLPFKKNTFDFVVSNFSIHWADLNKTIKEVKRVLKQEGDFVFNIPVQGSLEAVEQILGNTQFDFLCVPEILETLKNNNFGIEDFFVKNLEIDFPDGYHLLMHLHKTGVAINTKSQSLGEKRKIVQKFKSYQNPVNLNYKLLFVKAHTT